jgi:hypothetical protein
MRQLVASIFTLLLTASIALALDPQAKAEVDELISFVQKSDVRFIRNGQEYSAAEGADHLRKKLAKAGDRVKTTDDFITGVASESSFTGKPYLVKFADGHTQPTGDWLRAHLAAARKRGTKESTVNVDSWSVVAAGVVAARRFPRRPSDSDTPRSRS